MPTTTVEHAPLRRLGFYRLEERPWTNPMPPRGATGEEVRRLWLKLLRYHAEQLELRNGRCSGPCDPVSHVVWRYGQKIDIKVHESVIELLHRILASDAPFLCAHDCPHVDAGAAPDQLRRFLDTLDARAAYCREEARGAPLGDRVNRTAEVEIMGECRRHLAEATGITFPLSSPPAGWPPPKHPDAGKILAVSYDRGLTWQRLNPASPSRNGGR